MPSQRPGVGSLVQEAWQQAKHPKFGVYHLEPGVYPVVFRQSETSVAGYLRLIVR